jgi:NAD(P)-dependent dehydrogenase (short-subunit alcohol dehydrogenase family)
MTQILANKVAVVTGSSRGIGLSIAAHFAHAGASVVVSSRKAETCEPVADHLRSQGHDAFAIPCHVAHKEQLRALVDKTLARYGRIDILVCNAAVNPAYGPTAEVSDAAFDKILDANIRSTFWLCNMVVPAMAERRSGSVILVSSIAGLRGSAKIGCYGLSKAAEIAQARNLAVEWGPSNVRVNAIAPGLIETDFSRALLEDPERLANVEGRTPLRRVGQPDEIAGVALFLASDMSSYVTGQVIVADGGETIT